ncbi:hypothetical protein L208DRAFT_1265687, partial [Tricholoma matsutake]
LNRCLCRIVVNFGVELNMAIECRQPGCKNQWYHLQCIALEQVPTKWICEAFEHGQSTHRSDVILPF